MKNYLNNLPKELRDLICLVRDVASHNNLPAYLVGGFVRDLFLGVRNLDLDIVVEGDGIKFAQDLARALKTKLIPHRRFGTATIMLRPDLKIDVATARNECYPQPASLPLVTPGGLKDDLFRRDFTINAMAIGLNGKNKGKFIDFFQGRRDLLQKKIRIMHSLSFIDDPTRILRAIRFATRYNFQIETQTKKYLQEAVSKRMLQEVQPQRLREELILLLKEERPLRQIKRLQKLAGFSFLHPRLSYLESAYRLSSGAEKQIAWFKKIYPKRRKLDTWLIYFMGLVDSLSLPELKKICRHFVFRQGEEKRILDYKKISRKILLALGYSQVKPSSVFCLLQPLSYEAIILIKAKYKNRILQGHCADFFEIYNDMRIFITGDDLHRLGLTPGPRYQKIFTKVLRAKLNGQVKTKEEELALTRKLIKD